MKYRREYFLAFEEYYVKQLDAKLETFDLQLIVYDEIEYFQRYDNIRFNYPYTDRKSELRTYKFSMGLTKDDEG